MNLLLFASLPSLLPPSLPLFLLHNSCCGRELVAAAMSSQQLTPPTEPRLGSVITEKLPVFHHPHRLPSVTPVTAIPPVASGWQCSHAFPPPSVQTHCPRWLCVCVCVCVCLTAGRNTNCLESATLSPSLSTTVWHWLTPVDTREGERERERERGREGGRGGEGLRKKRKQENGWEGKFNAQRRRWRR